MNNKFISSLRSAVERCIAHIKNWKMIATGYRGRLSELPNIIGSSHRSSSIDRLVAS
ncbi:hypothetical protein [Kibdelosporangium philippinense]|uniref:hypothetical protein n=1 Tax=Kibdelosporangium philippinense TaxID=211113 RepID=UPI00360E403F